MFPYQGKRYSHALIATYFVWITDIWTDTAPFKGPQCHLVISFQNTKAQGQVSPPVVEKHKQNEIVLATRTGVYFNRLTWPWSFKTPTWRTLLDFCWSTQRPTSSSTWPFTMGGGAFTGRSQGSTPHKPSRSFFLVTPQRKSTRKSGWVRLWLAFRPKTKVWPEQHSLHL